MQGTNQKRPPQTSSLRIGPDSELREVGTHQTLLARRGIYYRLSQLQYSRENGEERRSTVGGG